MIPVRANDSCRKYVRMVTDLVVDSDAEVVAGRLKNNDE